MKTSRKIALGVITALGITAGTAALAHDHDGKMMGHGPGGHGAKGQCHDGGPEARLDALKSELKLSPAQEPAWQAFESAVQAQKNAHGAGHDMTEGTDPMQSRIDHMEKSLAGMKEIQKARTALYQVLTTEQKAVLDQHAAHGRHG
jgi:periplasmic protein CpxP/Spy